jgi:hypothetical protein
MKLALPLLAVALLLALPLPTPAQGGGSGVQLRYLGTAGWEITGGTTVVLIDPYLSRLRRVTPNDTVLPSDTRPLFTNDSIARSDTALVEAIARVQAFVAEVKAASPTSRVVVPKYFEPIRVP